MALDPSQKPEEKQGFLALGLKEGQSLPFLDDLGIPNRISAEGRLEWVVHDRFTLWLNQWEPFRDYIAKKEDRIYQSIFRGLNLFLRALMGRPMRPDFGGWPAETLPAPYDLSAISTLWEAAPYEMQQLAFRSAREFLKSHQD